jgi:hypothetical protein
MSVRLLIESGILYNLYAEPFWAFMEEGFESADMMVEMFDYPSSKEM